MNQAAVHCPLDTCDSELHAIQQFNMDGIYVTGMILYCLKCEHVWEFNINYEEGEEIYGS
jgi:hypothetical protein